MHRHMFVDNHLEIVVFTTKRELQMRLQSILDAKKGIRSKGQCIQVTATGACAHPQLPEAHGPQKERDSGWSSCQNRLPRQVPGHIHRHKRRLLQSDRIPHSTGTTGIRPTTSHVEIYRPYHSYLTESLQIAHSEYTPVLSRDAPPQLHPTTSGGIHPD